MNGCLKNFGAVLMILSVIGACGGMALGSSSYEETIAEYEGDEAFRESYEGGAAIGAGSVMMTSLCLSALGFLVGLAAYAVGSRNEAPQGQAKRAASAPATDSLTEYELDTLRAAKKAITAEKWHEARSLLSDVDYLPVAQRWMRKVNSRL